MRFLFVCGGTAGHINPALAIAGKLRELLPDSKFLFVGTDREMEKKLIPAEGFELETIKTTGFTRGISLDAVKSNIQMLKNLSISERQSERILKRFKPHVAIGTGGYVCYPILKKAAAMGIPTALHESNAIPGLTTKMLAGKVGKIMVAFPEAGKSYKYPDKVVVTGTPVRGSFNTVTKEEAKKLLGVENKPLVVSFWGSLGASVMNDYTADFIKLNSENRTFFHIHATGGGTAGLDKMRSRLETRGVMKNKIYADIRPYIVDMGTVMTAADLVMCRAGASTIAELTAKGKPSILVPSPNVTNNHQEMNARAVERVGGARVILERDCSGELLYNMAAELVADKDTMRKMSESAEKIGVKDSAGMIADIVLSMVN